LNQVFRQLKARIQQSFNNIKCDENFKELFGCIRIGVAEVWDGGCALSRTASKNVASINNGRH
jgi:hypothetical protein